MRSKLMLVALSAILVGGAGATLAGMSAVRPPSYPAALAANNSTGAANTTGSAPSATAASTAGPSATPTNTRVPTPRPTRTPTPIPVPGQTLTLHGDVASVDPTTNSFVVNVPGGGGSYTCVVSSSTQWTGSVNFSGLTAGMRADVVGIYQSGGVINPTNSVNAFRDD